MKWIWIGLGVLIALPVAFHLLAFYVLAPIKVKGSQHLRARPQYKAIDGSWMTPEMRDFVGSMVERLRSVGFEQTTFLTIEEGVPGVRGAQAILVNRATNDLALIILTKATRLRSLVYAIRTDYADGSRITTGMNRGIGMWPKARGDVSETFAFVDDPAMLYEAHRRQIARLGLETRPKRPVPAPGEETAFGEWDWVRNAQTPLRAGYLWLDEAAGLYRYTWKGAFLMTWKLATPVKQARIALRDARALRLWRQLGMPEVKDAPASVDVAPVEPLPVLPLSQTDDAGAAAAAPLRYETALAEGDVRVERGAQQSTVRVGGLTPYRVLGRHKVRVLSALFFTGMLAFAAYQWWEWRTIMRAVAPGTFTAGMARRQEMWWTMPLVWGGFLAWDVVHLAAALTRARGSTTITASRGGIRFVNACGRTGSGEIPRARLETIRVVLRYLGWRKPTYDLQVRLHGIAAGLMLATSPDKEAVERARDELAYATGIESRPNVEEAAGTTA